MASGTGPVRRGDPSARASGGGVVIHDRRWTDRWGDECRRSRLPARIGHRARRRRADADADRVARRAVGASRWRIRVRPAGRSERPANAVGHGSVPPGRGACRRPPGRGTATRRRDSERTIAWRTISDWAVGGRHRRPPIGGRGRRLPITHPPVRTRGDPGSRARQVCLRFEFVSRSGGIGSAERAPCAVTTDAASFAHGPGGGAGPGSRRRFPRARSLMVSGPVKQCDAGVSSLFGPAAVGRSARSPRGSAGDFFGRRCEIASTRRGCPVRARGTTAGLPAPRRGHPPRSERPQPPSPA